MKNPVSINCIIAFYLALVLTSCINTISDPIEDHLISAILIVHCKTNYIEPSIKYSPYYGFITPDITYFIGEIVNINDELQILDDSLNTYIHSDISIIGENVNISFQSQNIVKLEGTGDYIFPMINDQHINFAANSNYEVVVETEDDITLNGSTTTPSDFSIISIEDKYLAKSYSNLWHIRWEKSEGAIGYLFYIVGLNEQYEENQYVMYNRHHFTENEVYFNFLYPYDSLSDIQIGVDIPWPNQFFVAIVAYEENYYRYVFLNQDPAGWDNGYGMIGSTNILSQEFVQELND